MTSSPAWKWSQVVFKKLFFSIKTYKDLRQVFRHDFRQPATSSQRRKSLRIRYPRTKLARVNTPLSVRFCVVVVSIAIMEKSEIWSTRETRKPAPVFAMDSIKLMDRVCLVIEVGGVKYLCAVMPAAIVVLRSTALNLLGYQAIVRVVEGFKAGVPSDKN